MDSETSSIQVEDSDESLLDFKELNDDEFDLPTALLPPPSLESILWDLDSRASSDNVSEHSHRSASTAGTGFTLSAGGAAVKSMLYHTVLLGISAQVKSAEGKVGAGAPTSVANCAAFVSVGTSHGYLLTFDAEQKLCWCCRDSATLDQGAISAIAFNGQSTRVLVGFERGYILQLDAQTGDVVRRLASDADAHAPHSAVLQLRYCAQTAAHPTPLALVGDSSGCIFQIALARRLGVRTSRSSQIKGFQSCIISMDTFPTVYIKQETVDTDSDFVSTNRGNNAPYIDSKHPKVDSFPVCEPHNTEFVSVGVKTEDTSKHVLEDTLKDVLDDNPEYVDCYEIKGPYECLICDKLWRTKRILRLHIILHDKLDDSVQYNSRKELQNHVLSHDESLRCEFCHKLFAQRRHLTRHRRIHTGERPYTCYVCHKGFIQKCDHTKHMRTHTGEKPYECNICHNQFVTNFNLTVHMRTHTGEKPYGCDICHKRFTQNRGLTLHMLLHTGERPHQCSVCNKQFVRKRTLIIHMRTHTGEKLHQCNICHKRLSQKSALEAHVRAHSGEKPNECEVCHKRFNYKTALTLHKRIHTGEKPYQCDICHKRFSRKFCLDSHRGIKHGKLVGAK